MPKIFLMNIVLEWTPEYNFGFMMTIVRLGEMSCWHDPAREHWKQSKMADNLLINDSLNLVLNNS